MCIHVFHDELTRSIKSGVIPNGSGGVIPEIPILVRYNLKIF